MSTRVQSEEYTQLRVVQNGSVGLCEYDVASHQLPTKDFRGTHYFHYGHVLCATPDGRSIVLCEDALHEIQRRKLAEIG